MIRRRYSDEERATALAALAANGGNIHRTAQQLGSPAKTLENWARGRSHPEAAKDGEQKKGPMADALEVVARKLLDALPDKIAGASLKDLVIALGMIVDKMVLLRAQAPAGNLTDEQRRDRIRVLAERMRAQRPGAAQPGGIDGAGQP